MLESKKIAIIGSPDTVLPFKAIGADGYEACNSKMAENLIDEVVLQGYGIIYIEEAYAMDFSDKISKLNYIHNNVAITTIPGSKGGGDSASERLQAQVKKAIGIDIFAEKRGG